MTAATNPIPNDRPLDTPALVAQGFREAVEELIADGSVKTEESREFLRAGIKLVEGVSKLPFPSEFSSGAAAGMGQIVTMIVAAAGMADAAHQSV